MISKFHFIVHSVILLLSCHYVYCQTPASFDRLGNKDENIQDLLPGTHRARPVLGDFTNDNKIDVFYGGQDIGGSNTWYLKDVNKDNRWGDQGNGVFVNPVLNADYSDPDVIRVENKYYMICSDFHFMGMQVLESVDMINWSIIAQVYDRIDFPEYNNNKRYGGGSWAPSIRYHDNKFWIFFCTPNEGLFMSNAINAHGPWAPIKNIKHVGGWEDPCPIWDGDQAFLGRSQLGGGPIIIHKMSQDGTKLLDNGMTVYEGPTAEGTKLFKKDGYFYISIPEGGVATGWQTVLRSKNIYGPYEKKIVLEQGRTKINGPHQGALVDTPDGEWWFYHFQSTDPLGRIVHLQPVEWKDDWPYIGSDTDNNGIGEPVKEWNKPTIETNIEISGPQTDDDFSSPELSLQWQFNHNPVDTHWSLSKKPGFLTLYALKADKLRDARNMLTQKCVGFRGLATTELECDKLKNGQRAGLFCIGSSYNAIGIEKCEDANYIYVELNGISERIAPVSSSTLWFRVSLDANYNEHQFYYSTDNIYFTPCKTAFELRSNDWKGSRVGIFTYNSLDNSGEANFNWFTYQYDGPGQYSPEAGNHDHIKYADWSIWNEMAVLAKNDGNGKFTLVQEYEMDIAHTIWTNAVFFDYDNDGNLDLLVVGKGGDWRVSSSEKFACLYKNKGKNEDYSFEEVLNTGIRQYCDELYLNTISAGDYDRDGFNDIVIMCHDGNNGSIDLYKNNFGNGTFTIQPNTIQHQVSSGSVMFGDINQDGWLDIFFTGEQNNTPVTGVYENLHNGTFKDVSSTFNILAGLQSQSTLADIDGNGTLDVFTSGKSGWRSLSSVYYNRVNDYTKEQEFILQSHQQSGLLPVTDANVLIVDLNNDGLNDMIINGTSNDVRKNRIYYQKADNTFSLDSNYPLISVHDGGMNLGDINGDGNMDLIIGGYKSDTSSPDMYNSPVRIYQNHPAASNRQPSAPSSIEAVYENNQLTIRWGKAFDEISPESALRYNLFVRNDDTKQIWMLIPADITTGQLKTGTDLQISLSSQVNEYSITSLAPGNYTIGVQALDQSYAGSLFTIKNLLITSKTNIVTQNDYRLTNCDDGIIFHSSSGNNVVTVRNLQGQKIADGFTNSLIPLMINGIYIAQVNGSIFKILRNQ